MRKGDRTSFNVSKKCLFIFILLFSISFSLAETLNVTLSVPNTYVLSGQTIVVTGIIRNSTGSAISNANVSLFSPNCDWNYSLTGTQFGNFSYPGFNVLVSNLSVGQFNGTAGTGTIRISGCNINVNGSIDAYGRGYGGGGGGAGCWFSAGSTGGSDVDGEMGNFNGVGLGAGGGFGGGGGGVLWGTAFGIGTLGGGNGSAIGASYSGGGGGGSGNGICNANNGAAPTAGNGCLGGGNGGAGGTFGFCNEAGGGGGGGAGPFGGNGGAGTTKPGTAGSRGGYNAAGANTDSSTDLSLNVGSGGGGGGGSRIQCNSGLDGGAGGQEGGNVTYRSYAGNGGGGAAGGGSIFLSAYNSIFIRGTLNASGGGKSALNGGYGAGGGILLMAKAVNISLATIRTLGGDKAAGGTRTNGGTVKIFYNTTLSGSVPIANSARYYNTTTAQINASLQTFGVVTTNSTGGFTFNITAPNVRSNYNLTTNATNNSNFGVSSLLIQVVGSPEINFNPSTPASGTNSTNSFMPINVSARDNLNVNITINIYNQSGLVRTNTSANNLSFVNFTGLASGTYYINATATNIANYSNSTETRVIILDFISPNATLLTPLNATTVGATTVNFTANITDNVGVQNATLHVINSTGHVIVNRTYGDTRSTNNYLSFDGSDDYVEIPASVTTDLSRFTISFWVKTTESDSSGTYWQRPSLYGNTQGGSPDSDFGITTNSGTLCIWGGLYSGGDNEACSSDTINDGAWHYIAAVRDSNSIDLYLDGSYTNTYLAADQNMNNYGYWLGAQHYYSGGGAYFHQSDFDYFSIYNRSLSESEVLAINNSGRSSDSSLNSTGLVVWYDFEDASGMTLTDRSGNGNDGTLTNGPTWQNETAGSYTPLSAGVTQTTIGVVVSLLDGIYSWFYDLFDWAGNSFQTGLRQVTVDLPPVVTLISPVAGLSNSQIPNLTCRVSDGLGVENISLYVWNNTDLVFLGANNLSGVTSADVTWDYNLADGNYTYNCLAVDFTQHTLAWAASNVSVQIDDSNFVLSGSDFVNNSIIYYNYLHPRNLTFNVTTTAVVPQNLTFELYSPGKDLTDLATKSQTGGNCGGSRWGASCDINVLTDNNDATYYGLRGVDEHYIQYDFSSTKIINSVKINWKRGNGGGSPGNYNFQYYNGVDWITPTGWDSQGSYQDVDTLITFTLTNAVSTSAIRLHRPIVGNGQGIGIREMEVWGMEKISNSNNGYFSLVGSDTPTYEIAANATTQVKLPLDITSNSFNYILYLSATRTRFGATYNYETPQYLLRFVLEQTAPVLVGNITSTPNRNDDVDPNTFVQLNASMNDTGIGIQNAIFQLSDNNGSSWTNLTTTRIAQTSRGANYSANFTTSSNDTNYTVRLWSADILGNTGYTNQTIIPSLWDCSWNAYTDNAFNNTMGTTTGFGITKQIRMVYVNNTGDYNYTPDHCRLRITFSAGGDERFVFNNSDTTKFYVDVNNSLAIPVDYTFRSFADEFDYTLSLLGYTSPTLNFISTKFFSGTMLTQQDGPYLAQEVSEMPTVIYLKNETINFGAYIQNAMGDDSVLNSAYNVSSIWNISEGFVNITGSLEHFYENLSNSSQIDESIVLDYSDLTAMKKGYYTFNLTTFGYENVSANSENLTLMNRSVNNTIPPIYFSCYILSDGVPVWDCLNDDPDTVECGNGYINNKVEVANESCDDGNIINGDGCSSECAIEPQTTTIGGGAGGGGGGGGGAGSLSEKSDATFELLSGKEQEFTLRIDNKLESDKRNINVSVSGINQEYLSFAKTIKLIPAKDYVELKVKITAPAYFTQGKYVLKFNFAGDIMGNTTTKYTETKTVTLYITELTRVTADIMLNESFDFVTQMNESGMILKDVESYLASMNSSYNDVNFLSVRENFNKLKQIYTAAFEAKKLIEEMNNSINEAEYNGIDVLRTKKLFYTALVIYQRGDYLLALSKLQETRSSYLYEAKGEYNVLVQIKNNPLQSFGIFLLISGAGAVLTLAAKYKIYKNRIKLLGEEEKLLLQLMKTVQRECFERNRMSMEEYEEAMIQYERKLGEAIEDRIRIETRLVNLFNLKGKSVALQQEKERLVTLMRVLQNDYLVKGKVETRIYDNMMKTYLSRLSKVEEELVFIEANEAIKKSKYEKKK